MPNSEVIDMKHEQIDGKIYEVYTVRRKIGDVSEIRKQRAKALEAANNIVRKMQKIEQDCNITIENKPELIASDEPGPDPMGNDRINR